MENSASLRFTFLVLLFSSMCLLVEPAPETPPPPPPPGPKPDSDGVPEGFILDVKVFCGATKSATPRIQVISDLSLEVEAICENGVKPITSTDGVNYVLHGSYSPITSSDCQFTQRDSSNIFTADVSVAFGLIGSTIQQNPQFYTLTCTFAQNGKEETEAVTVIRGYVAPVELRVDAGSLTTSVITLDVFNVRDEEITDPIIRGCKVYIGATTDGSNSEVGLRPTACDAINPDDNTRLPILRAGCGTGLILPQGSGFTTDGTTVKSPYFEAVQFEDNPSIQFECSFTLCSTNCDGNSCEVETPGKRKRSAVAALLGAVVRSPTTTFKQL